MTDEDILYQRLNMTDEEYKDWLWMMNMSEALRDLVISDKKWLAQYRDNKNGKI